MATRGSGSARKGYRQVEWPEKRDSKDHASIENRNLFMNLDRKRKKINKIKVYLLKQPEVK